MVKSLLMEISPLVAHFRASATNWYATGIGLRVHWQASVELLPKTYVHLKLAFRAVLSHNQDHT